MFVLCSPSLGIIIIKLCCWHFYVDPIFCAFSKFNFHTNVRRPAKIILFSPSKACKYSLSRGCYMFYIYSHVYTIKPFYPAEPNSSLFMCLFLFQSTVLFHKHCTILNPIFKHSEQDPCRTFPLKTVTGPNDELYHKETRAKPTRCLTCTPQSVPPTVTTRH